MVEIDSGNFIAYCEIMQHFFDLITRNALLVLAALAAITLFFAAHLGRLHVDTSVTQMIVKDLPEKAEFDRYKSEFGWNPSDILVVFKSEDVFSPSAYSRIKELTEALRSVEGVKRVASLSTLKYDLDFLNEWTLEDLKRNVFAADIFVNHLVSEDGKTAAIIVVSEQDAVATKTSQTIERILEKYRDPSRPFQIYQIGTPVIGHTLTQYTQRNLVTLPVLAALIMFLVLIVCFQNLRGALVPLSSVGLSLVWTFGLMGLADVSLSMVTMIIPVLVIAVGTAYALHIMAAYNDATENHPVHREAVVAGLIKVCLPTLLACLTTIVGFASLLLNEIEITRDFALFSCVGIFFLLTVHLTYIPALLSLLETPYSTGRRSQLPWIESFLTRVLHVSLHRPKMVFVASALVTLTAVFGLFRIQVETTPINYFKKDDPLRMAFDDVYKNLSGIYPVNVILRSGQPGYFKSPEALRLVESFQEFAVGIEGIDMTTSVVDLLKLEGLFTRNFADKSTYYVLPDDPFIVQEAVKNLRLLDGDETIDYFVSKDFKRINITCRSHATSTSDFIQMEQTLSEHLEKHLPEGVRYDITGLTMAISHSSKAITLGQIKSLALAMFFVFVLLSFLFLSPRVGLYCMLPNMFPILVNFGVMGWFGIDLCVATSLIASIAIGLSVDDTIHYAFRYNHLFKTKFGREKALLLTTTSVGKPILFTSLAVGLGFSVLLCSSFVPTILFGILMLITAVSALAGDLIILPAILYRTDLVTLWDFVAQATGRDFYRRATLLINILRSQAGSVVITGFEKNFKDKEIIFEPDQPDDAVYLILRGKVLVRCLGDEGNEDTAELVAGDVFSSPGDLYCGGKNAKAMALEKTRLFQTSDRTFQRLKEICSNQGTGIAFVDLTGARVRREETYRGVINCRCLSDRAKLFSCWVKE